MFICQCTNQLNRLYQVGNVRSIFRIQQLNKFNNEYSMNNSFGIVNLLTRIQSNRLIKIKKFYKLFSIFKLKHLYDHFVNFGTGNFSSPFIIINFFLSYWKKITSNSDPNINSIVISSLSIDHSQNHFLPGIVGITYDMHYYITPSTHHSDQITVTQIASVDYRFVD